MKKLIVSFLAVAVLATSVFAIDLSVGGNVDYTYSWNSVSTELPVEGKVKASRSQNYVGFNVFFDAQYVRLMFGPNFSVGKVTKKINGTKTSVDGAKLINLNLAVLGKYPFSVGKASIFPMVGFDFSFNVSVKLNDVQLRDFYTDDTKKDANHYFFVAGFGADVPVAGSFFITPTALFGVDLKKPTIYEVEKKAADTIGTKHSDNTFMVNIGLGFGYKL